MIQKSTNFTTIFRVKKCYFHYDFACKKVPLSLRYAKNEIKAEGGKKSLYATRLAINLYWAYWLMDTRSLRHSSHKD
jgi:hypothetical protein